MERQLTIEPEFELAPHQRKHYERILKKLGIVESNDEFMENYAIIDTSAVGTGKTRVACNVGAAVNPNHVIIISPVSSPWERDLPKYNLDSFAEIWTYHNIIVPKNKYMSKSELTEIDESTDEYIPTERYTDMLRNKAFIVFDEVHYAKNDDSKRTLATQCIIRTALKYKKNGTRVLLLSATANDKPEMKHVLLHNLDVMKYNTPYTHKRIGFNKIEYYFDGLLSIRDWLDKYKRFITKNSNESTDNKIQAIKYEKKRIDSVITAITEGEKMKGENKVAIESIIGNVYDKFVFDMYTDSMPNWKSSKLLAYSLVAKEMWYDYPEEEKEVKKYLSDMLILQEDRITGKLDMAALMTKLTKLLKGMEKWKAKMFARLIYKWYNQHEHKKFIVQFNYYDALDVFIDTLEELGLNTENVLYITGEVKPGPDRQKVIKKFQKDDDEYRILILTSVGSVAIDLDDTSEGGIRPRVMLINTSYNTTNVAQVFGRIHRVSSTSNSVAILMYYSFKEKVTNRFNQKNTVLRTNNRSGSIAITDNTPIAVYRNRTDMCDLYVPGLTEDGEFDYSMEYATLKMRGLVLGEFNEEAYQIYAQSNPLDLNDFNTPLDRRFYRIYFTYINNKGKERKNSVIVGTDLEVDAELLLEMNDDDLIDNISEYYEMEDIDREVKTIEKVTQLEGVEYIREFAIEKKLESIADAVNYFFPGFREAVEISVKEQNEREIVSDEDEGPGDNEGSDSEEE